MKLVSIWLINQCNYNCYYCPAKKWHQPIGFDYPNEDVVSRNRNDLLLPYMDRYLDPDEWIVELTGGEPGLYPEMDALIPELDRRGYHGVIKTNGSLPIPKPERLQRIAAWHRGKPIPVYYDTILIIKNPDDDWEDKVEYCEEHEIPHRTCMFNTEYRGRQEGSLTDHRELKIAEVMYVNAFGQISRCWKDPCRDDICIRNMSPPRTMGLTGSCGKCVNAFAVQTFLPPEAMGMIERDRGGGNDEA